MVVEETLYNRPPAAACGVCRWGFVGNWGHSCKAALQGLGIQASHLAVLLVLAVLVPAVLELAVSDLAAMVLAVSVLAASKRNITTNVFKCFSLNCGVWLSPATQLNGGA